jgi:hypothetical protein
MALFYLRVASSRERVNAVLAERSATFAPPIA